MADGDDFNGKVIAEFRANGGKVGGFFEGQPLLLLQLGGTLQILDGFQSNPYRAVSLGPEGREPQERLPQHRQRYALFVRAHQAIVPLRAAARASCAISAAWQTST